jgi:hypothetical protein
MVSSLRNGIGFSRLYLAAGMSLWMFLALSTAAARADSFGNEASFRDLQQTLMAREALFHDDQVGPLNLGVRIEDRIALLWGPVPDMFHVKRAVDIVKKVPGVLEVRSQLHVDQDNEDWLPLFLPETRTPAPPMVVAAESNWVSSKPLPKPNPLPVPISSPQPQSLLTTHGPNVWTGLPVPMQNVQSFKPVVIETPARSDEPGLFVLPVAVMVQTASPGYNLTQRYPVNGLEAKILQLKNSQFKFREVEVQVAGGKVYLSGTVQRLDDIHDLARAISYLPDVEQVVIGQIRTKSGGP